MDYTTYAGSGSFDLDWNNYTKGDDGLVDKTALEDKALLSVKEMCAYLSIGQTKCRELLSNPANGFTVRIGNRLYAHKKHLDKWLENQIY